MENEDDWQYPEKFSYEDRRNQVKVVLKNVPEDITDDGLRNMCEIYGKVISMNRPTAARFAFVEYSSAEEVANLYRRFKDDNPYLPITIEAKREKEEIVNHEDYDFLDKPALINNDTEPMRNVFELNKRKIQGPFSDPTEIVNESLIIGTDYRNILLKAVDKSKTYCWDTNDEAHVDCESDNGYKIVHGRAILKSSSLTPADVDALPFDFNSGSFDVNISRCVNCSLAADKKCKQCELTFCSLDCHEAKCKKTKEIDEKMSSVTLKSPKIFNLGNPLVSEPLGKTVKITYVVNHRMLFVRPADDKQEVAFVKLLNDTVKCAIDAKTYTSLPSVSSLVLAKFDYYQRALVLKHLNDTEVAVAFIDFGNIEIRKFSELKIMPTDLQNRKRFATKIQLKNINEDLMNVKSLEYLYHVMMYDIELKITKEIVDGKELCELKSSEHWINQMVNDMNIDNIHAVRLKDMSDRLFSGETSHLFESSVDLKGMSGKEVIIMDNSQIELKYISILPVDDVKKFLQDDRRIQNICNYLFKAEECFTPKTDEYCVVRKNGRWYRAECVEIYFDGFATVRFIDYGPINYIEINDIRALPDALIFKTQIITDIDCFKDYDQMSQKEVGRLKEKFAIKSRHRVQRMEMHTEIDKNAEKVKIVYAWFEPC